MRLREGEIELSPADIRRLAQALPPQGRPGAILRDDGPQTYQWMQTAMTRARSVGAVLDKKTGRRHGTCFLVTARDVGIERDAPIVLTVSHLVGTSDNSALRPRQAQVIFEASEQPVKLGVAKLLWSSSTLDASLLELTAVPRGIEALPLALHLPVLSDPQRVYLLGYAGGRSLAFSFLDNELLDHEGPPDGHPSSPGLVRLHYRAPTETGSGGSPVFNDLWEVIAVHQSSGTVSKLNGKTGTYSAKEGIWIQSIVQATKNSG
jgi:hypothetical protein